MTKKYDFSFIEKKWQTIWENEKTFDAKIDKSKKNGAQIGVTWNKKVFDYLFESGLSESEISRIIGIDDGDFIEEEIEL